MKGQILLTPDELAQMVGRVVEGCGLPSEIMLAIRDVNGNLVDWDNALITYDLPKGLPRGMSGEELREIVRPPIDVREILNPV